MNNIQNRKAIMKKIISAMLTVVLLLSVSSAIFADTTGVSDVSSDAWYSEAVAYVQENKLMDGISEDAFEPNTFSSRIVLTLALYRAEGSPEVSDTSEFSDVENGTEYGNAVSWAAANGIVGGYGNGIFGTDDPITREQIATIFWRYAGQPETSGNAEVFADQNSISEWAAAGVEWVRENNVMNGKENNIFDPQGNITRAEIATVLMNYLTRQVVNPESEPQQNNKTLVVYFSMPETANPDNMTQEEENSTVIIDGEVLGNTQYIAYVIQENTGADTFRIEPETPYPTNHATLVDLAKEEQNESFRPVIKSKIENIEEYDTIFLGYPNWWGDMPMIVYSFLEEYDLSGKTIIPFNTHGGSGFSDTINTIAKLQPNATVDKNGFTVSRNSVQSAESDVIEWLRTLGIID